jgi:hypothetical protein
MSEVNRVKIKGVVEKAFSCCNLLQIVALSVGGL